MVRREAVVYRQNGQTYMQLSFITDITRKSHSMLHRSFFSQFLSRSLEFCHDLNCRNWPVSRSTSVPNIEVRGHLVQKLLSAHAHSHTKQTNMTDCCTWTTEVVDNNNINDKNCSLCVNSHGSKTAKNYKTVILLSITLTFRRRDSG